MVDADHAASGGSAEDTSATSVSQVVDQPLDVGVPLARPVGSVAPGAAPIPHDEMRLPSLGPGSAWFDIGCVIFLLVAYEFVTANALGLLVARIAGGMWFVEESIEPQWQKLMLVPMLAVRAVGTFVIIAWVLKRRGQSFRSVGVTARRWLSSIPLGIAASAAAGGLIVLTMLSLFYLWPDLAKNMNENKELIMSTVPHLTLVQFALLAIVIGVYEEFLFRGFLMTRLRRATGSWTLAVVLSTVVFTALHAFGQTTVALVPVTILSLVFSFLTIWRRSIIPAIVAHAMYDASVFSYLSSVAGETWH